MNDVRTWIEIDENSLRHNAEQFLKLIPRSTFLMAVVKSNAYGHGLTLIAKQLAKLQITNYKLQKRLWFGVDSLVEGVRLRKEGIKNPILVLGYTLPNRFPEAAKNKIALSISNFESLSALARENQAPRVHIKIDTGMHRQGFTKKMLPRLFQFLREEKIAPEGIFTHLAAPENQSLTTTQIKCFREALANFEKAGVKNFIRHVAATGGTLLRKDAYFDMVRIGMGLYGYFPSVTAEKKAAAQKIKVVLKPILSWKTLISEIKEIPKGVCVGYDCTCRVKRHTKMAVLPIGYWHGFDRGLSRISEVIIRGKRAKLLGRVSMDMIVVDVTDIPRVRTGDEAVLIGKQRRNKIWADELSRKIGTTQYEFLTRLNPLIRRLVK